MPEPPPSYQPPAAEVNEALRFTFEANAPPHQVLCFCHKVFRGESLQELVDDFARTGAASSLSDIAVAFANLYHNPFVQRLDLTRLMQPLLRRLDVPLDAAVTDPNWRASNRHVLELHGLDVCGQTTLPVYESGKLPARIVAWNVSVIGILRARCAETPIARLEVISAPEIAPFEALAYLMRTVIEMSWKEILSYARTPLLDLARVLEARCSPKDPASAYAFERLRGRLGERFCKVHLRNARKWQEKYGHLFGRVIGETILENYEMSVLPEDISGWAWSVGQAVRKRYIRGPLG